MINYRDYIGGKVHLIGIGGSSMSGIAFLLQEKGCIVSGSDKFDGRETDPGDISSQMIVDGMRENGVNAYLMPTLEDAKRFIQDNIHENDMVITLGCGNINMLNDMLMTEKDK